MTEIGSDAWIARQLMRHRNGRRRLLYDGLSDDVVRVMILVRLTCAYEFATEASSLAEAYESVTELHECGFATIEGGIEHPFHLELSSPEVEITRRAIWDPINHKVVRHDRRQTVYRR